MLVPITKALSNRGMVNLGKWPRIHNGYSNIAVCVAFATNLTLTLPKLLFAEILVRNSEFSDTNWWEEDLG